MLAPGGEDQSDFHDERSDPRPRLLVVIGVMLLVAMMLAATFALGVYVAERDLFG